MLNLALCNSPQQWGMAQKYLKMRGINYTTINNSSELYNNLLGYSANVYIFDFYQDLDIIEMLTDMQDSVNNLYIFVGSSEIGKAYLNFTDKVFVIPENTSDFIINFWDSEVFKLPNIILCKLSGHEPISYVNENGMLIIPTKIKLKVSIETLNTDYMNSKGRSAKGQIRQLIINEKIMGQPINNDMDIRKQPGTQKIAEIPDYVYEEPTNEVIEITDEIETVPEYIPGEQVKIQESIKAEIPVGKSSEISDTESDILTESEMKDDTTKSQFTSEQDSNALPDFPSLEDVNQSEGKDNSVNLSPVAPIEETATTETTDKLKFNVVTPKSASTLNIERSLEKYKSLEKEKLEKEKLQQQENEKLKIQEETEKKLAQEEKARAEKLAADVKLAKEKEQEEKRIAEAKLILSNKQLKVDKQTEGRPFRVSPFDKQPISHERMHIRTIDTVSLKICRTPQEFVLANGLMKQENVEKVNSKLAEMKKIGLNESFEDVANSMGLLSDSACMALLKDFKHLSVINWKELAETPLLESNFKKDFYKQRRFLEIESSIPGHAMIIVSSHAKNIRTAMQRRLKCEFVLRYTLDKYIDKKLNL